MTHKDRDGRDRDGRDGDDHNDDWKDDHDWKWVIERTVNLRTSGTNTLRIELRSKPGTHMSVRITGNGPTDTDPPTITATASPVANSAGWNRTDVQVTFTCSDTGSGIASCPPSRVVSTEGQGQVVSGTATDKAGNTATASVTLNIDRDPADDRRLGFPSAECRRDHRRSGDDRVCVCGCRLRNRLVFAADRRDRRDADADRHGGGPRGQHRHRAYHGKCGEAAAFHCGDGCAAGEREWLASHRCGGVVHLHQLRRGDLSRSRDCRQ